MKKTGYAIVGIDETNASAETPASPSPETDALPSMSPDPTQPQSPPAGDNVPPSSLREEWFLCQKGSVVSKVARILVCQGRESQWEHTIQLGSECLQQKVLTSLQINSRP